MMKMPRRKSNNFDDRKNYQFMIIAITSLYDVAKATIRFTSFIQSKFSGKVNTEIKILHFSLAMERNFAIYLVDNAYVHI